MALGLSVDEEAAALYVSGFVAADLRIFGVEDVTELVDSVAEGLGHSGLGYLAGDLCRQERDRVAGLDCERLNACRRAAAAAQELKLTTPFDTETGSLLARADVGELARQWTAEPVLASHEETGRADGEAEEARPALFEVPTVDEVCSRHVGQDGWGWAGVTGPDPWRPPTAEPVASVTDCGLTTEPNQVGDAMRRANKALQAVNVAFVEAELDEAEVRSGEIARWQAEDALTSDTMCEPVMHR